MGGGNITKHVFCRAPCPAATTPGCTLRRNRLFRLQLLMTCRMWNILDLVTNHVGGLGSPVHSHASRLPGTAPVSISRDLCIAAADADARHSLPLLPGYGSDVHTPSYRPFDLEEHFNNCDSEALSASPHLPPATVPAPPLLFF